MPASVISCFQYAVEKEQMKPYVAERNGWTWVGAKQGEDQISTTGSSTHYNIEELLNNPDITEEVKALVSAGDIDGAEALVGFHYEEAVKTEATKLAAKLHERGQIKALKLKFSEAASMYEKASVD